MRITVKQLQSLIRETVAEERDMNALREGIFSAAADAIKGAFQKKYKYPEGFDKEVRNSVANPKNIVSVMSEDDKGISFTYYKIDRTWKYDNFLIPFLVVSSRGGWRDGKGKIIDPKSPGALGDALLDPSKRISYKKFLALGGRKNKELEDITAAKRRNEEHEEYEESEKRYKANAERAERRGREERNAAYDREQKTKKRAEATLPVRSGYNSGGNSGRVRDAW